MTANEETVLHIRPEQKTVKAGRLLFIPLQYGDSAGNWKPMEKHHLKVTVENATLEGLGSACSYVEGNYAQNTVDTYYGEAMAVVRAGEAGSVKITVSDEERTYTCEICGDSYEEVIEATGHTVVTDAAVAAACETTGLTEGSHCSVCKTVLVAQKVIPAAGHKWSEYRESGKVKRKCSVCGKTETVRTLPKVKMVQLSKTSYTYDGKSHMPTVKVTNSAGKKLKEGTDYKIKKPSGRKNAGIYTVTIEMKGDYTGKYQKTFRIIPKGTAISSVKAKKKAFTVSWKKQAKQIQRRHKSRCRILYYGQKPEQPQPCLC